MRETNTMKSREIGNIRKYSSMLWDKGIKLQSNGDCKENQVLFKLIWCEGIQWKWIVFWVDEHGILL